MRITNNIYFYPSPKESFVETSGTVIIAGNNKQIIIDPGTNIRGRLKSLLNDVQKDGLDIDKTSEIWLTHVHPDHFHMIYDLYKRKKFGEKIFVRCHPIGCHILAHPVKENFYAREVRKAGKYWAIIRDAVNKDSRNAIGNIGLMTLRGARNIHKKITNTKPFFDGEVADISPVEVQIMFLPGHTPDEIGFWIAKEKILIVGDLAFAYQHKNNKVDCKLIVYNFHADLGQAIDSFKKMKQIGNKNRIRIFSRKPETLIAIHGNPVRGKENIQGVFNRLIFEAENYKDIAKKFIVKSPELSGVPLVMRLAEEFSNDLLGIEQRFIAYTALKLLEVIK